MFVKNNWEKEYFNGKIGTVVDMDDNLLLIIYLSTFVTCIKRVP